MLKHTPPDHHDRIPLQMALTELENLTHKLNETKRESEGRFEAKRIVSRLSGRNTIKSDERRYLVRQEDVTHIVSSSKNGMKTINEIISSSSSGML